MQSAVSAYIQLKYLYTS